MGRKRAASLLRRATKSFKKNPSKLGSNGVDYHVQKKQRIKPENSDDTNPAGPPAVGTGTTNSSSVHGQKQRDTLLQPWTPVSVVHSQAAQALERLMGAVQSGKGGCTLKSLTLAPGIEGKRATHAVTTETIRHLFLLRDVVRENGLLEAFPRLTAPIAYVLAYDALFGEGVRPTGSAERAVRSKKNALKALVSRRLKEQNVPSVAELINRRPGARKVQHQRALRVNTLRTTVEKVEAELRREGHTIIEHDPVLNSVLLLAPNTDLHELPAVRDGRAFLQSRASCMTACALAPPAGARVLDACAAPGNKTTQLAAMVGTTGSVLALDMDARRVARLKENVVRAGAGKIVESRCADFLELDPKEHGDVKGILLDPSCSGSGTEAARLDAMLREEESEPGRPFRAPAQEAARIQALSTFQRKVLEHALSFPAVQRIAYSTCSVYVEENEAVVAAVLPLARRQGFELAPALSKWPRRGLEGECEGAEHLLRTDPDHDGTDGFFVAVFERQNLDPSWATHQG